ncbi:MAG: hypothetical protein IH599_00840, partial [Bacteroidales bacterium]|nr:hypothetical protein [Bacteroidales bacterium]
MLAWTITNTCGYSSDWVTIGFAATPNTICIDTLTDARDGQKYPVVGIGNQCWMARNLNIGTMVSSVTGEGWHSDQTNNGIIEKYCHNNDSANCVIYGGLYEWAEMMEYA